MPLKIKCSREYFKSVVAYAKSLGGESWESFKNRMKQIANNGDSKSNYNQWGVVTHLYKDFAPYSFEFARIATKGKFKNNPLLLNGGVICHGANSSGIGMPEMSVTLSPQPFVNWQIHT